MQATITPQERIVQAVLDTPPGPKRWRAARDAWLQMNPAGEDGLTARTQHQLVCQQNAEAREENRNVYGTSGDPNSGLRRSMSFPSGAVYAIELADPQAFKQPQAMVKMRKTFPEYCTSERY